MTGRTALAVGATGFALAAALALPVRFRADMHAQTDQRPHLSVRPVEDFEVSGKGDHAAWQKAEWVAMRRREGEALGQVLNQRMNEIETLAGKAEAAPGRRPEAVRARLAEQIALLLEATDRFDADRLTQEALLLAAKADIREELDRIASHITQARELIGKGGPIGRRLDFLAQEFHREVNTCCSKSNDLELTNTGLEMKSVVEQFREQVQNLE